MKLYYCDTCGLRIPATEIPADQPEPADGKYFCSKHRALPKTGILAKPPTGAVPLPASGQHSRTRITPAPGAAGHGTRTSIGRTTPAAPADSKRQPPQAAAAAKAGNKNVLIFGSAGALFVILAAVIALSGGDKPKSGSANGKSSAIEVAGPASDISKPDTTVNAGAGRTDTASKTPAPQPSPAKPEVKMADAGPEPRDPLKPPEEEKASTRGPTIADLAMTDPLDAPDKPAVKTPEKPAPAVVNPIPLADPRDLVKDGGFESGSAGSWGVSREATFLSDPAKAHTGLWCGRLGLAKGSLLRQVVKGLTPGGKYIATAWVNGAGGTFAVREYGGPDQNRSNHEPGYQQLSIPFELGPNAKSAKIVFRQDKGIESFIDDVTLIPADAAPADPAASIKPADKAPEKPAEDPTLKFQAFQDNAFTLLEQGKVDGALAACTDAKADPLFAALGAEIDATVDCVKNYDAVLKAMPEGVKKLNDGRAFTFKKKTGRDIPVGGASKASVVEFKDGELVVETKDGGLVATQKIIFDELTDPCKLQLAALALPRGPESEVKLGLAEFLLYHAGRIEAAAPMRAHLERAKKAAAAAAAADFITHTFDTYVLNQRIDAATRKIDAAVQAGNAVEARTLYDALKKEMGAEPPARFKKYCAEHHEFEYLPGLWVSYFSGPSGKDFEKYHLSRVETKLYIDWRAGSPDASIPTDNFTGRFCGILRVEKGGDYTFLSHTDDCIRLVIDGHMVLENYNFQSVEGHLSLTPGDHKLAIFYHEIGGDAQIHLRWKLDGGFDVQEIPLAALWYDPMLKEQYQKPEK